MANIRGFDPFFEPGEVDTPEKIKELIKKERIKLPGVLVNAIISHLVGVGKVRTPKECEKMEKILVAGINQMKRDMIEASGLLEKDDVDWKKFNVSLMLAVVDEFFSEEQV